MTLSSIREELFHYFKARIDAMFVYDIIVVLERIYFIILKLV